MGGALLLERFWWASSLTCCSVRLRAGMESVTAPWRRKSNGKRKSNKSELLSVFCDVTSGGVFAGGVVSEALEEALDGEGLTDSFESLAASLAALPFTCKHKHPMRVTEEPAELSSGTFSNLFEHSCSTKSYHKEAALDLRFFPSY